MKIKWGILGPGRIAEKFTADFSEVSNGEVCAVASRSKEKALQFAAKHKISKAFGSYVEMLSDPEIDIIYIATPHSLHFEHTKLCFNYGKQVLCEKPVTVNAHQFKELMVQAKKQNLFYMEAMWSSFLPTVKKALDWVTDGKIGEVQFIQASFGFASNINKKERLFSPELAGGSLLDVGIYPLTFFEMFANSNIQKMNCSVNFTETGVDELLAIQFDYKNGIKAQMASCINMNLQNDAIIYGSKGCIRMPKFWMSKEVFLEGAFDEKFVDESKTMGYNYEIEAVNNDLLAKKAQNATMPLSRTLRMMELMDQIRENIGLKYPFE